MIACDVILDRGPEKVKIFHYSSDPKPWARFLDPSYATFSEEARDKEDDGNLECRLSGTFADHVRHVPCVYVFGV